MRKFKTAKLDTKVMVDVAGASLIVQQVPALLQEWFGLDNTISQVGAVGVAYVAGSWFNRPTMANAAIALFALDMVMPMISGILPGGTIPEMIPTGAITKPMPPMKKIINKEIAVSDYFSLNDYTNNPQANQNFAMYRDSY